jgi:hypothetical protein
MTVEVACRAYVDAKRSEKVDSTADDAKSRSTRLVSGERSVTCDSTSSRQRVFESGATLSLPKAPADEEDTRRARDSANRNLSTLEAALNIALSDQLMATDAGRRTVTAFREVGRKRELFLTREQRDDLIEACPAIGVA